MCSDDDDSVFRREDVPVAYRYEPPGATKAETIWLLASTNAVVVVIAKRRELDSRIMVDVKKVGKERRKVKYVTKDERRRLTPSVVVFVLCRNVYGRSDVLSGQRRRP
jgi:hypothetical protein